MKYTERVGNLEVTYEGTPEEIVKLHAALSYKDTSKHYQFNNISVNTKADAKEIVRKMTGGFVGKRSFKEESNLK